MGVTNKIKKRISNLSSLIGITKPQKDRPVWLQQYKNDPRAISPDNETTETIINKMKLLNQYDTDKIRKYPNAARLFIRSRAAQESQNAADSNELSADLQAAYDNFYSSPTRDIVISNLIRYGHVGTHVKVGWFSPNTGKEYILNIKIPEHLNKPKGGGKSKRVKRSKTCKSKRVKRSKTCKNRIHKRRN
jgi:hypothetical protein